MDNTNNIQLIQEAYNNAQAIYLNYKENPTDKGLGKAFKVACEKYSELLEKYNIDFNWVYTSHYGLWEYHPVWKNFVASIMEGLNEREDNEEKLKFLRRTKSIFIKDAINKEAYKESPVTSLATEFIGKKIQYVKELEKLHISGEGQDNKGLPVPPKYESLQNEMPGYQTNIPEGKEFETPIKEYSPKELRGLYDMSEKLFRSQIGDHEYEIGKLGKSRRYTIKQVYMIFHLLGDPALKKKV